MDIEQIALRVADETDDSFHMIRQNTYTAVKEWRIEFAKRLEAENAGLQAKIDRLMLEYCPDEMTLEQIEEWGRNQQAVSPEMEATIDAAKEKS